MLDDISLVTAFCSSTAAAIVAEISLIVLMVEEMSPIALDRLLGGFCTLGDLTGDFLGGLAGLGGERFHLGCDDGETPARLAGARGFDRRVQRQQVGLRRDGVDQVDDVADAARRRRKAGDDFVRPLALFHGLGRKSWWLRRPAG